MDKTENKLGLNMRRKTLSLGQVDVVDFLGLSLLARDKCECASLLMILFSLIFVQSV